MKNRVVIISFSILLIILNSCTNAEAGNAIPTADKKWLQDPPCALPCWQQITPQQTRFDDVLSILSQEKIPIEFRGRNEKEIDFQFEKNIAGTAQAAATGLVDHIALSVSYEDITLSDLDEIIGQPEKVHIVRAYSRNWCEAALLYQTQGIMIDLAFLDNRSGFFDDVLDCKVDINMNSLVYRIVLAGSFDSSEIWKNVYSKSRYIDWKGYGIYQNYPD